MDSLLNILLIVLLLMVIILQVVALIKLKQKNKLILKQSEKIKFQAAEQERRNKQVEELVHEKQQLISVVSHDLKGPFNRIFALVQLMEISSTNLTYEQKGYLNKMHQIVADGLSMIRNLLDRRRLEEKGLELTPERINLSILIGSLVKNYRTLAEKKRISVELNIAALVIVMADKQYLHRALENLLSNALKFSPEDKRISVSVSETSDSAIVKIQDEGPGISEEDQKKLYINFQKLSARPTGGESSTGLGLSIAKTILDKLGAEIQCKSKEGEGTLFSVTIKKATEPVESLN